MSTPFKAPCPARNLLETVEKSHCYVATCDS
ncbi:hypothetical protein predicted by Glimmer/Critica [Bdellovibrio bacteriovorus HD100]|uniref:Uncharacterized protein n=1 Tax=Bdellovibrio bacteriovorus (strain ATCC 15356 / DSM 50701 / NCIMB 9529 / HD100) TaxID=264462 RepID=Q6MPR5_BDEBA|nr:hypothetical protein predicted by Glimmer/Critica [Bdellovibrio bacteriovorus HD100]